MQKNHNCSIAIREGLINSALLVDETYGATTVWSTKDRVKWESEVVVGVNGPVHQIPEENQMDPSISNINIL